MKLIFNCTPICAALLVAPSLVQGQMGLSREVVREAYRMGTTLRVDLNAADRAYGLRVTEEVLDVVRRVERRWSSWSPESALSAVNRCPVSAACEADALFISELQEVRRWVSQTEGAFDPAIGAWITAWDFRGEGRVPNQSQREVAAQGAGLGRLLVDSDAGTVQRTHHATWLSAGAFGKGLALRQVRDLLRADSLVRSAALDFGGQVLVVPGRDSAAHVVQLAHPGDRQRVIGSLRIRAGSVATSGQSERSRVIDGQVYGHILDPRSGEPVAPWGSVSVIHNDPFVADVVATALVVMGPTVGWDWAQARSIAAVFVELDVDMLRVRTTEAAHSFIDTDVFHTTGVHLRNNSNGNRDR